MSLTFTRYKTCNCVTSTWGGAGGYLDFSVQDTSNSKWVLYYWTAGTTLTAFIMFLSLFYITVEWCQQSFLSTENYEDAMQGLRMTRSYRQYSYFVRLVSRFVAQFTLNPLEWLAYKIGLIKTMQNTIVWTKGHKWNPQIPQKPNHTATPSFELTDFCDVSLNGQPAQETPALAHSLFPPAIPMGRRRTESDTSLQPPYRPEDGSRISGDSFTPLVRRPSETHHTNLRSGSISSGERRISSDHSVVSVSPPDEQTPFSGWLGLSAALQPRHTYTRANSDPGSPPYDLPQPNRDALGIYAEDVDLERGS